jgi:hypothetical protein
MKNHIAVALDNIDQVAAVSGYLTGIAEFGTRIDLLLRTRQRKLDWLETLLTGMAIHDAAALAAWEQHWDSQIAREKQNAERKIAPLKEALATANIAVEVHVYAGSFKRALHNLIALRGTPLEVLHVRSTQLACRGKRVGRQVH